jgi:hypothetical protein
MQILNYFNHSNFRNAFSLDYLSVRKAAIDILYTLDSASNYSVIQKLKP